VSKNLSKALIETDADRRSGAVLWHKCRIGYLFNPGHGCDGWSREGQQAGVHYYWLLSNDHKEQLKVGLKPAGCYNRRSRQVSDLAVLPSRYAKCSRSMNKASVATFSKVSATWSCQQNGEFTGMCMHILLKFHLGSSSLKYVMFSDIINWPQ
jgi:hypothetical protein